MTSAIPLPDCLPARIGSHRPMPHLTLYPAIDLKDGACVRLKRGAMEHATIYATDPAAQARAWQDAGFQWLHVVDLNGAFAGRSENAKAVAAILAAARVPVQLGGGIRDLPAIEAWLTAGVRRVILGSAAVKTPDLVRAACRAFPNRIAVGIDAREGFVATEGWAETSTHSALDLARRFEDAGVAAIIYTDIARDGMLTGLNLAQTADLARQIAIPVIASGGVGSLADLAALRDIAAAEARPQGTGIQGVIVGRALYDGRLDPAEALTLFST
jgi:phosphoribosylformimino-5-aminoimidazole carboxamide ribotide isomerase